MVLSKPEGIIFTMLTTSIGMARVLDMAAEVPPMKRVSDKSLGVVSLLHFGHIFFDKKWLVPKLNSLNSILKSDEFFLIKSKDRIFVL